MGLRSTALQWGLVVAAGWLAGAPNAFAQTARPGTLWHNSAAARAAATRSAWAQQLTDYRAVEADATALATTLAAAPLEGTGAGIVLELPTPDGGTARFRVVESPVMEAPLAAQYPQIRTYAGVGIDDPAMRLRCDLTPQGFHAQVLTGRPGLDFKLDPVDARQPGQGLVSYWRASERATPGQPGPACHEVDVPGRRPAPPAGGTGTGQRVQASMGTSLRTYRWAVAATGEYTAYHGGTVSSALAAITTMANRVSGVFEYEMAVRLMLIANETAIIYTDAATDPYTGGNKSAMLDQNRTNLNSVIGNANFDLGHVLDHANLGGVAYVGVVCNTTYKGGGVSGLSTPAGSAFEGVVAHETGHQFSARHTFSGTAGSCTPANPTTGWEPGSGSTIMSYAGNCSTDNIDGYHLAVNTYFHGGSIEQMANYIASSGTCAASAPTGNTVPTVTAPASRTIPASTPFQLTATASDADGDVVTYSWEQMDVGSGPLVTTSTTQTANSTLPLFRSWPASYNATRYFPRLSDLRANTSTVGEVLPTVGRTMKFRCTVRDQHNSSALGRTVGGINQSSNVTLTVVSTGAAFAVTAPTTTGITWNVGAQATVTWDVAGTTANGINCASVNILLSTDGGQFYPVTLAASTPNDGSETITVPANATTQARVMVAAVDNYFFDISNQNFTIAPAPGAVTTVTGFSPAGGTPGTVVTITGTNFTGTTGVTFNGSPAASYTVVSATQITATVPALASTGPIAVTTPGGGTGTSPASFAIQQANDLCTAPDLPWLYCGVPVRGATYGATTTGDPTGTCGTTINAAGGVFYRFTGPGGPVTIATCTGTNYDSKLFVFTGSCGALTCVGGNDDACSTGSSVAFTSVAGTVYTIMVAGYNSNQGVYTLTATCGSSPPAVSSFTPASGPAGTSVTITGTGFTGATDVKFNSTSAAAYTVSSATQITATVPPGATTGPVSVTTATGTGTSATAFTVIVPPANDLCTAANLPVLTCGSTVTGTTINSTSTGDPTGTCTTSISATAGGVFYLFTGTGGAVTLTTCGLTTDYDSKLFVFTGSCGALTCVAGNDDVMCGSQNRTSTVTFESVAGTTYYVFVSGFNGARGNFILGATCAPPTITSFSPASGLEGAGVELSGTVFATASAVTFNGTAASFTVNSNTSITAMVPAGATTGPITVVGPTGTATSATGFTVLHAPVIADQAFAVAENAALGTSVGTVVASDPDAGETLRYHITAGDMGGAFTINNNTGELSVTSPAALDFEAYPMFTLTVSVTDSGSPTTTSLATVTVNLTNVVEAPAISSFSPASGLAGTTVTVTGANFQAAGPVTVRFNGTPATVVTVTGGNSLTAQVPVGAGTGAISVTNADGTATSSTSFTVPAPTIASFTPTSGYLGTAVTISGNNFTGAIAVRFNGVDAAFTVNSNTSISTSVPGGATTGKLSVVTGGGTATSAGTFTVLVPTISSFSPSSAPTGTSVTVTGNHFSGATSVAINGSPVSSFTVSSNTSISLVVPATATTGRISVVTPTGTGTSALVFKVLPTLSSFSPASGAPGTVVTITGSGFTGATAVKFNLVAATSFTVVDAATITATVPATATTGKVSVVTAGGTATSTATFTVAPIITGFIPAQGAPGSIVLVQGLNLTSTTTVAFNGVNAVKTYNSATQITATVPGGATTGPVSVSNAAGSGTSATDYTVVSGPIPTITSFSPTSNVVAGTVVTITGTNFTGATLVRFNNVNATSFTVNSATQVQAAVPAGALTGKVYVATPNGMAQSPANLTIIQPPTISSFSPASGAVGSVVLIAGTSFTNVSGVTFNGVPASYTVNSAAQIAATVPAGAATGRISVTTIAGTATSAGTFTLTGGTAPAITGLAPASGPRGSTVVLTGSGFSGVTGVKLGAIAVTGYTVDSPTQITLTVPATATTAPIYVTTSPGGMAQSATYTVILPPTISSFSPTSGSAGTSGNAGTLVTINGTNFTGATSVTFGTGATSTFTVVSPARITVNVPSGATTGTLKVTNAAGTATSAGTFTVLGLKAPAITRVPTEALDVQLYPNPARDWVEVQLTNLPKPAARADLLDHTGRLVQTLTVREGRNHLPLTGLAPGLYVLRIEGALQRLVVE